jgi:DNA polymerase-3 subunit delta'
VLSLEHPDVYWAFPRPRLKESDNTPDDALEDLRDAAKERAAAGGLYARPPRSEGIYLTMIQALVQRAALSPAVARRKVLIVGDAERMVVQEGSDQAANAFLKLLEEPPEDTTIILTSSESGALLPTIHSRVVAMRCAPLADDEVLAFVRDPVAKAQLDTLDLPRADAERVRMAEGAPGTLLSMESRNAARAEARRILTAAASRGAERYATALAQGSASARGAFSDALGELALVLRERVSSALSSGDTSTAYRASRAIDAVCEAQARADGNVNPQLITAALLRALDGIGA